MSRQQTDFTQVEQARKYDLRLPLVTAADAGPSYWNQVQYNQHQGEMLKEHARQRAPSNAPTKDRAVQNHLLGIAAELATATWRNGRIDVQIYNDYVGDGGVDMIASSRWSSGHDRYQVKATWGSSTPERTVSEKELEVADYFILCCSDAPQSYVDIVGYTDRKTLKTIGTTYGHDGYLLSPQTLSPLHGKRFSPEDVSNTVQL